MQVIVLTIHKCEWIICSLLLVSDYETSQCSLSPKPKLQPASACGLLSVITLDVLDEGSGNKSRVLNALMYDIIIMKRLSYNVQVVNILHVSEGA